MTRPEFEKLVSEVTPEQMARDAIELAGKLGVSELCAAGVIGTTLAHARIGIPPIRTVPTHCGGCFVFFGNGLYVLVDAEGKVGGE